ncbi:hypothetical protein EZS27_007884 [termite gut metagenome]|uniref:Uncharacterized protein n=1 Tax=termite gut metagenome TaxID=433724 RepID=A0A5J4SEZ5_9ZZZZ
MGKEELGFFWSKTFRGRSPKRFSFHGTKFHHRIVGRRKTTKKWYNRFPFQQINQKEKIYRGI